MIRTTTNSIGILAAALATSSLAQEPVPLEELGLIVDIDRPPDQVIPLWPGTPPGGQNVDFEQFEETLTNPFDLPDQAIRNVTRPTLSIFHAEEPDGSAMLITPGGGYSYVLVHHGAWESARWFSRRGVTVYVLTYRLPQQDWAAGPDTPLQDAQRAMRVIRSRAAEDGIDPSRVLVLGFSAGGHLAGTLATRFTLPLYDPVDEADRISARPDAVALVYPIITMREPDTNIGARTNLIGPQPRRQAIARYSLEIAPPADTPPVFLVHASDDFGVSAANSLSFYRALDAVGVPAAVHLFATGGHGFGMRILDGDPIQVWPELLMDFGREQGVFGAQ